MYGEARGVRQVVGGVHAGEEAIALALGVAQPPKRVEDALRILVRRRVARALRPGAPAVTTDELIEALGPRTGSTITPWIGAGAARLARTGRAAKVLGGRTPLGLAVRFGPALSAAVLGNVRGLDAAIARLVTHNEIEAPRWFE